MLLLVFDRGGGRKGERRAGTTDALRRMRGPKRPRGSSHGRNRIHAGRRKIQKQHVSNPFLSRLEFDSFLVNISPETVRRYPAHLMTTCCLTIDPHHRFRPPSRLCVRAAAVWQSNRHLCLYLILLSYPSPSTLRVPGAAGGPSPPTKGRRDGGTEGGR